MGFWSKPKPPKPLEEMTQEELEQWKKQNKRAVIILAIGCALAGLMILRGIWGVAWDRCAAPSVSPSPSSQTTGLAETP